MWVLDLASSRRMLEADIPLLVKEVSRIETVRLYAGKFN